MNLKYLKTLIDPGSLNMSLEESNGTVCVDFKVGGILFSAQYDSGNSGLYAFGLCNKEHAEMLFKIITTTGENNDSEN